jgi:hypothetical protein
METGKSDGSERGIFRSHNRGFYIYLYINIGIDTIYLLTFKYSQTNTYQYIYLIFKCSDLTTEGLSRCSLTITL